MLNSTPNLPPSEGQRTKDEIRRRRFFFVLRPSSFVLSESGGLHQDHDEEYPDAGDDDGEAREGVAGPAAEGAGAAHAAERPGQSAALAALNQHHQNKE